MGAVAGLWPIVRSLGGAIVLITFVGNAQDHIFHWRLFIFVGFIAFSIVSALFQVSASFKLGS